MIKIKIFFNQEQLYFCMVGNFVWKMLSSAHSFHKVMFSEKSFQKYEG